MSNSERRLDQQPKRKDFHEKNIEEFKKFKTLELDFTFPRKFEEIEEQISKFYLRKKMESKKAIDKVKRIINEQPEFKELFENFPQVIQMVKM